LGATTAGALPAPPAAVSRAQMLGFLAMVFGMFMAILDIQIVASSIAEIQAGLSAAPEEASWVQTSYLVAEIVMIPLSGFLSRLWSTRVLFVASCLGFTAFSLACALATSLPEMIVLRALQGFFGGAMIPAVFATSYLLFTGAQRVAATAGCSRASTGGGCCPWPASSVACNMCWRRGRAPIGWRMQPSPPWRRSARPAPWCSSGAPSPRRSRWCGCAPSATAISRSAAASAC
jgi:MFS family permease